MKCKHTMMLFCWVENLYTFEMNLQIVRSTMTDATGQVGSFHTRHLPVTHQDEDDFEDVQ